MPKQNQIILKKLSKNSNKSIELAQIGFAYAGNEGLNPKLFGNEVNSGKIKVLFIYIH